MDVLHDRVVALDVHKSTVVACLRTPGKRRDWAERDPAVPDVRG